MILLIDNYDSFTHNLARYFRLAGRETVVVRNDAIDADAARRMQPEAIVLSPGPGEPSDAGCCLTVVRDLADTAPMLGVCLGHQVIAAAFGAAVVRAAEPWHGRTSRVGHTRAGLFDGVPDPTTVCRYHSLVVDRATLPAEFETTAWTDAGEVMAIAHRELPLLGVQFHPEAILTDAGPRLIENFLRIADAARRGRSSAGVED